ncbi:trigger factor [Patescibacteria group bacterium]
MQVKITEQKNNQAKIAVTIPEAEVEKYFDQAIKQIGSKEKFEGFRPGKAPRKVIESKIGTEKIHAEVIKIALDDTYPKALEQVKIIPIDRPKIQVVKFAPKNPFSYTIDVNTFPEVTLGNYKEIKVEKPDQSKIKVDEKEIADVLNRIQKQLAEYKEKKTAVQKGDKVEIDFDGFLKNVPLEDATSKNHPVVIGEGMLVKGFEDNLIGMKTGEEKEFEVTFPKVYPAKHLADKKVKFKVKVNKIFETKMPKLDDELAKKINPEFDLKKLKEDVQKSIIKQKNDEQEIALKSKVIDKVVEQAKVEIVPSLIDEELENMIKEATMKLTQQGSTFEKYLERIKKTKEEIKKEWRTEAEKRIKTGLVIAQVAKEEKITVPKKDIDAEIQKQILQFAQFQPQEMGKLKKQFDSDRHKKQIELTLRNRKAIDKLVEYAQS